MTCQATVNAAHGDATRGRLFGALDVAAKQPPGPSQGSAVGLDQAQHAHELQTGVQRVRAFPVQAGSVDALQFVTRTPLLDPRLPEILLGCWDQAEGVHQLDLMRALVKTGAPAGGERLAAAMLDRHAAPEVRKVAATLVANFDTCVEPLLAWWRESPDAARTADLIGGLGRRPENSRGTSWASPNSGLLEFTSTFPSSIVNFTALERSFESRATRRMAFISRSRSNSMRRLFPFGITRSNAGNCPSIIREISMRLPT